MNHGNKKGDWIKTATAEEIQNHIEKLEQNICSCKEKIEWYKAEQERRKQEVPLGVPCEGRFYVDLNGNVGERLSKQVDLMFNSFHSEKSAEKHAEMLLAWRKALVANANGNQIDIKVLSPLLEKGKVAFCPISRSWFWAKETPQLMDDTWGISGNFSWIGGFNIKPAEDWRESLKECGL